MRDLSLSRRHLLASGLAAGITAAAGCLGIDNNTPSEESGMELTLSLTRVDSPVRDRFDVLLAELGTGGFGEITCEGRGIRTSSIKTTCVQSEPGTVLTGVDLSRSLERVEGERYCVTAGPHFIASNLGYWQP